MSGEIVEAPSADRRLEVIQNWTVASLLWLSLRLLPQKTDLFMEVCAQNSLVAHIHDELDWQDTHKTAVFAQNILNSIFWKLFIFFYKKKAFASWHRECSMGLQTTNKAAMEADGCLSLLFCLFGHHQVVKNSLNSHACFMVLAVHKTVSCYCMCSMLSLNTCLYRQGSLI